MLQLAFTSLQVVVMKGTTFAPIAPAPGAILEKGGGGGKKLYVPYHEGTFPTPTPVHLSVMIILYQPFHTNKYVFSERACFIIFYKFLHAKS